MIIGEKIKISSLCVLSFLRQSFDKDARSLNILSSGRSTCAFSFKAGNKALVIRLSPGLVALQKDERAYGYFVADKIPIPKTIKIGEFNKQYFFSITEKRKGRALKNLSDKTFKGILPDFIRIADKIHRPAPDEQTGYGYWDGTGNAKYQSWKEFLINNTECAGLTWRELFKTTFLEKELYKKIHKIIEKLADYCPEERFLVHGDFGFDNVLFSGRRITAVLDWGNSLYGDFLYDVADLDFWMPRIGYDHIFEKHYKKEGIRVSYYEKRLLCYKAFIGLRALGFFARFQKKKRYNQIKKDFLRWPDKYAF